MGWDGIGWYGSAEGLTTTTTTTTTITNIYSLIHQMMGWDGMGMGWDG